MTAAFLACAVALFVLSTMFKPTVFVAGMSLIGLCFGGFLALYPALTSDYYGSSNFGINYGVVFTAYGAGSVLGPIMASYFRTFNGSYVPAFYISAVLALLGMALALFLKTKSPH